MDLNEISVFLKVVQAGSFTRAAAQLGIPNSTASARVSAGIPPQGVSGRRAVVAGAVRAGLYRRADGSRCAPCSRADC